MPKISIMSDTDFHEYNPLQMRTIYDGTLFYETVPVPKAGNNGYQWRLVKLIDKQNNGAVKLGKLERGKTKDGAADPLAAVYIVYGSKIRRSVNLSGPGFTTDFNGGVLEFFGAEYPAVATKASAGKYAGTEGGYKALVADLAAGK